MRLSEDSIGKPPVNGPLFHIDADGFYSVQAAKPLLEGIDRYFPDTPVHVYTGQNQWINAQRLKKYKKDIALVSNPAGEIQANPLIQLHVPPHHPMPSKRPYSKSWETGNHLFVNLNPEKIKFEVDTPVTEDWEREFREEEGIRDQLVLVAGSLDYYPGSDDFDKFSEVDRRLRKENPGKDIVSIVASRTSQPRQRFRRIFGECNFRPQPIPGLPKESLDGGPGVLVLAPTGELPKVYSMADAAYVAGSHNILEPAEQGVPVIYRRDNSMFPQSVKGLEQAEGGFSVDSTDEMVAAFNTLIRNPDLRKRMGDNAKEFKDENRGVTEHLMNDLKQLLDDRNQDTTRKNRLR